MLKDFQYPPDLPDWDSKAIENLLFDESGISYDRRFVRTCRSRKEMQRARLKRTVTIEPDEPLKQ